MERTYKGIRITGRLHKSGKIEARWTYEKKRFSCYGRTWEDAVESAILRLKPVLAVRDCPCWVVESDAGAPDVGIVGVHHGGYKATICTRVFD